MLASIDAPVFTTQPLTEDEVCTREMDTHTSVLQSLDRLAVQQLGCPVVGEQCARPGFDAECPVRACCVRPFLESPQRRCGLLVGAASSSRLDEFEEGEPEDTQVIVFTRQLGARQGGVVTAEAVVQHRAEVAASTDASPLASQTRIATRIDTDGGNWRIDSAVLDALAE